ncbi:polysaccharide lyase [Echinicola sp. 20G]|uniref:polysaccharide lyase n=1 Tax=Echinicola sp. 20G TaxID=2781961 RepID=UPI0019100D19|nr:polysaccharide lyase [Echinicola sp. 20G]
MKSTKFNYKGLALGLSAALFITSCQIDESQQMEIQEETDVLNATVSLDNFFFYDDLEGSNPLKGVHVQNSTSYGMNIVSNNVFKGSKAIRMELRDTDELTANGTRTELLFGKVDAAKEKWYSFAAYFPSDGYKMDRSNEIITQWHQGGKSPALSLRVQDDKFCIRTLHENPDIKWKYTYFGNFVKDKWTELVFHVVHSGGSDGLVEIWQNGTKVLTHKGKNTWDDADLPNWKIGIYKAIWNKSTTDTDRRVVYYDNIKIGNKNISFEEMISDVTFDLLPSLDLNIEKETSISVVDATTETIYDEEMHPGEIYWFSRIGTEKLNFVANVDDLVKRVKFKVFKEQSNGSYAEIRSSEDKRAPFCLFGDNGKGNYYYGDPLNKGKYKIYVYTYADEEGKVAIGETFSSSFKLY